MTLYSSTKAFSLIELIIVLVIVAIVLAVGIPGVNKARADAEVESMRTRAVQLQSAKQALISEVGLDAATTAWNGQTTDALKYSNLLRQHLPSSFPVSLAGASGLIPDPYLITLNGLEAAVVLRGPDPTTGQLVNIPLQKY